MTTLNFLLAHAVARTLKPGDEIVVTEPRPRRERVALAAGRRGPRPGRAHRRRSGADDVTLDVDALEALLGERTRVVAFTLASNALGSITDAGGSPPPRTRAGALAWADAVHLAPAPPPATARRLGARRAALLAVQVLRPAPRDRGDPPRPGRVAARGPRAAGGETPPGHRFETGTQSHEAIAGTTAAIDYLRASATATSTPRLRDHRAHEDAAVRRASSRASPASAALDALRDRRSGARRRAHAHLLLQPSPVARRVRSPSGWASRALYVWDGDYYALAADGALGLSRDGGAVRAGFLHYTTEDEVDRLLAGLARLS